MGYLRFSIEADERAHLMDGDIEIIYDQLL
jgi:hypothetical protein